MSKKKRRDEVSKVGHMAAAGGAASQAPAASEGAAKALISREDYEAQLHMLQVELVKLQRHFIGCGDRILVLLEGRDAAGKDGSVKRIVEYLSPRETRVVALGKPSDRERSGWYFQRLNLMRDILSRLHYAGKNNKLVQPDPDIAFEFTPDCIDAERLAR